MKETKFLLVVIGVCVGASGFLFPETGMQIVDVCVGSGERAGVFADCPTVPAERYIDNSPRNMLFIGGGVMAVVGLLLPTQRGEQ